MVFVHALFGDAVEGLLRGQPDLEIAGRESDPEKAIARIRELCPDVVILDNDDPVGELSSLVARILGDRRGVRVIGLNLEDTNNNTICTYHGEQRIIRGAEDLVELIETQDCATGLMSIDRRGAEGETQADVFARERQQEMPRKGGDFLPGEQFSGDPLDYPRFPWPGAHPGAGPADLRRTASSGSTAVLPKATRKPEGMA